MIKLTKRQKEILTLLRDNDDEIVINSGQCWVDQANIRTNKKLVNELLRYVLISANGCNAGKSEYYHINESGLRLLAGETKIYRGANGKYYESFFMLMNKGN